MPKSTGEHWLGAPGAAEYLGVTLRTVYKLIDEGRFPAYKLGRVIRIRKADLDKFLKVARIEPGALRHLYPPGDRDDGTDPAE